LEKNNFFDRTHLKHNDRSATGPVTIIDKMKVANDQIKIHQKKETNWYVITGGPARHYLDTQLIKGKTIEEVRSNQKTFQLGVLEMQIEQEAALAPEDVVFLDRAIPNALAYYRFLNLTLDERLIEALNTVSYKKVFILDAFHWHRIVPDRKMKQRKRKFMNYRSKCIAPYIFQSYMFLYFHLKKG
jgi:predicted ATPase